jgi:hypothetical protein
MLLRHAFSLRQRISASYLFSSIAFDWASFRFIYFWDALFRLILPQLRWHCRPHYSLLPWAVFGRFLPIFDIFAASSRCFCVIFDWYYIEFSFWCLIARRRCTQFHREFHYRLFTPQHYTMLASLDDRSACQAADASFSRSALAMLATDAHPCISPPFAGPYFVSPRIIARWLWATTTTAGAGAPLPPLLRYHSSDSNYAAMIRQRSLGTVAG